MAHANASNVGHIYDPEDAPGTNTDVNDDGELVVNKDTVWRQLCDQTVTITNDEYDDLFDNFEVRVDCLACNKQAMTDDPEGFIYKY
jgi:hypothetical protein